MIYKVKTAKNRYTFEEKTKLEKLGFKFCVDGVTYRKRWGRTDAYINGKVQIDTLETLHKFIETYGPIVVSTDCITIYDGWLE